MLEQLKFVMGAVAKKDLIPSMKHFAIADGQIRAYNGALALSSPIEFDIDCKPRAVDLVQAISNCTTDHTVTISMTPTGKLRIINGPYRAYIDCIEEETPHVQPEGIQIPVDGETIREALRIVEPFISTDASRPWSNGVFLSGGSCFATNNVCAVEYWLGQQLPFTANVPREAVREILRVGEIPTTIQLDRNSITFHFESGRWIRSQLLYEWSVDPVKIFSVKSEPKPFPTGFFEGLSAIKPFMNKQREVYFYEGGMHTSQFGEGESGSSYMLDDFPFDGCYTLEMLQLLEGIESIDLTSYPRPCMFFSGRMRGAIIGRSIKRAEKS